MSWSGRRTRAPDNKIIKPNEKEDFKIVELDVDADAKTFELKILGPTRDIQ